MSEGGESPLNSNWIVKKLDRWMRRGKKADITKVTLEKLQEAHDKRGVVIDDTRSLGNTTTAQVDKIAVNN